jgi:Asp-tRNA(Asn)/Glu-tRNA(Gln) amidotransferase C subunit
MKVVIEKLSSQSKDEAENIIAEIEAILMNIESINRADEELNERKASAKPGTPRLRSGSGSEAESGSGSRSRSRSRSRTPLSGS